MPRYLENNITATRGDLMFNSAGTIYTVETVLGVLYAFYIETQSTQAAYRKSIDGGATWGAEVILNTNSCTSISVWYDRWSNIAAGLIHIAITEQTNDDTFYRSLDTENSDTLSTATTIFAGLTAIAAGACLSITRAVGGNLYCKTVIDQGTEGGFFRSVDIGANWTSRTVDETLANQDQIILLPDLTAADNQDIIAIFWDNSATEVSRKLYDDSANSWSETSIAGPGVMAMPNVASPQPSPNFNAAVDITNSQIALVAWEQSDAANADLRCWKITNSAITEVTNVVLNSADDQGLCAIGIDTVSGEWHVLYGGKSDGSETFATSMNIYRKISADQGSTWSAEEQITNSASGLSRIFCAPRFSFKDPRCMAMRHSTATTTVHPLNFLLPQIRARVSSSLGL